MSILDELDTVESRKGSLQLNNLQLQLSRLRDAKHSGLNKAELFCEKRGAAALLTKKFWVLFNP